MNYSELIKYLYEINATSGMKLGLENAQKLQTLLHFPDKKFQSIHVAGTNGKGSVSTKIAAALQEEGYCVGLFTSPHLSCFRERIRINNEMIPESAIETLLPDLFALAAKHSISATIFEFITFLAFLHFANEKIDFAVLETGLGGRLDATNIISPLLSVITSISLDHTDLLGTTIESITKEKGGIIKPSVPVVIGPTVPRKIIEEIAQNLNSPLIQVTDSSPFFEIENRIVAKKGLETLQMHLPLSNVSIEKGLNKRPPSRFEIIEGSPLIILDVAHNPDGLYHLFNAIHHYFPIQRLSILFGLSQNKDLDACLKILSDHGSHFHIVEAANGRGAKSTELATKLKALGTSSIVYSNISTGLSETIKSAKENNEIVVICGSFFIMGEVRQQLGLDKIRDEIDLNERRRL